MPLLDGRNLTGGEVARLGAAIRDAFRTPPALDMMLGQGLNISLWNYVPWGTEYDVAAYNLVLNLQAEGKTADLLIAARLAKPGNVKLLEFAQGFGLTALPPQAGYLERIVKPKLKFLDVQVFIQRLGEVEGRVGRVEVETEGGTAFGTGFLVGPDTVLTNSHVIESAAAKARAGDGCAGQAVTIRFDYKVMSNGGKVFPGTVYTLAGGDDWLADSSPPSAIDSQPDPKLADPDPAELDYAVLRLASRAAEDPVGGALFAGPGGSARGFVAVGIGGVKADFAANAPLLIFQHPDGSPLRLALDFEGVIGRNPNGTRVRYKNNTQEGSSGSPCFNAEFQPVALHHSGDPKTKGSAEYNEGIPLHKVRLLLESREKGGLLG